VLVTLRVVSVNAVGVNRNVNFIGRRVIFVESKRTVEILKGAVQPAVAQVLNAEVYEGVLPLFINGIVRSNGATSGEQQTSQD
jgi:hypothetical protein